MGRCGEAGLAMEAAENLLVRHPSGLRQGSEGGAGEHGGKPANDGDRTHRAGTALDGVASRPHVQDRTSSNCLPLLEARTAKASGVMVPCPPARPSPRRGLWALMEGDRTARKRHEPEEMVAKLRQVAASAPRPGGH